MTPTLRKAYKAAVCPPEEAIKRLWLISRAMVHLWNRAIVQAQAWLDAPEKEKKKPVTAYSFNYWLTNERQSNITLKDGTVVPLADISSDLEREVLRKLAGSYQSFFELKKKKDARARTPWTKEEDRFQTLSWSSFTVANGMLSVPGMDRERIVIPLGEYLTTMIQDKAIVHATVAFRDGRFELSLVTAVLMPPLVEHPMFFRAIDLGAGDIAVTDSDGSEFLIPSRRPDKFWRPKVKSIEARVEQRHKGSRGWKRLMRARRHILNKSGDQHISHQRKLAHALVEDKVQCIVIGKPKTRLGLAQSASGTNDEHWGSQNTGYMFRQLLYIKEKAQERGVKVIEFADPVRTGNSDDPATKFSASRLLLAKALELEKSELVIPVSFTRKHFCFEQ